MSNNGPRFVGLVDPRNSTTSVVFYADSPGYLQNDQESLLRVLSSEVISGVGPYSVYTKTAEGGLAYGSSLSSNLKFRLLTFYAAKSPDIASLLRLVNDVVETIPQIRDERLIDYAFQNAFPIQRSMFTFTERGKGISNDIRDGNTPELSRRFLLALLQEKNEPDLRNKLLAGAKSSVCPILIRMECTQEQLERRSLFFFTGPERQLAGAENKLGIRIGRIYPSDFWLDLTQATWRSLPSRTVEPALKKQVNSCDAFTVKAVPIWARQAPKCPTVPRPISTR
jgi:hypothetical protein